MDVFEASEAIIEKLNLSVVEKIDLEPRKASFLPLPDYLRENLPSALLSQLSVKDTVYRHQAFALEAVNAGKNIVVATGTASGKSLIFQLYALHLILSDPEVRVLVMYPQKALASDQESRWRSLLKPAGLGPEVVAKIDGDVPTSDRDALIRDANILICTPDVFHAWFLRNASSSWARRFLDSLSLLVLDEAHVYESVFGSNVAFLMRRLISAKRRATKKGSTNRSFQIIAATATIAEPEVHLKNLTGQEFFVVSDSDNGAPSQKRRLIHVVGDEFGAAGEACVADLIQGLFSVESRHRFIAFLDSRQGTERIVKDLSKGAVFPYRSGYELKDRTGIEKALRSGALDGVVATSALELGIDIADMAVGINLGVPQSKKAFRQRIGRIGRSNPGVFFVIAPPNAFRRYGETFSDYYHGSVEPSYLYLGNRFIQYAHARCLIDESEGSGTDFANLLAGVSWPDGFEKVLGYARPGGGRPREFDFMATLGADAPHYNYPLRQVGEASFQLKHGSSKTTAQHIGSIATNQAIREAYPGGTYIHLGTSFKVQEWSTWASDRTIRLTRIDKYAPTKPLLRKIVNFSLAPDAIVDGRIMKSKTGFICEAQIQVNESVEGYRIGKTAFYYKDLRAENPNMSRKQRDFRTTGVIVQIDEPWFAGSSEASKVREGFAEALSGVLSRDKSISPQDIDATHSHIAVLTESGPKRLTNTVVVYDSVFGGLRLTEDLFEYFSAYLEQVERAAEMSGTDAILSLSNIKKIRSWSANLVDAEASEVTSVHVPDGWLQVYKPGSIVSVLANGTFVDRTIIEPRLVDPFDEGKKSLYYKYETKGGTGTVPHEQVQANSQEWQWVLWNPETGEYQEIENSDEP